MSNFEFFEHTADIGIRVRGKDLCGLFINSAQALFNILIDCEPCKKNIELISIETDNLEDLLVYWLNELVSMFFAYKFIPLIYNIDIVDGSVKSLKGDLLGEKLSDLKFKPKTEVKACTYHNLKIKNTGSGFVVEIIFDV